MDRQAVPFGELDQRVGPLEAVVRSYEAVVRATRETVPLLASAVHSEPAPIKANADLLTRSGCSNAMATYVRTKAEATRISMVANPAADAGYLLAALAASGTPNSLSRATRAMTSPK